jgi:hypothetical protein
MFAPQPAEVIGTMRTERIANEPYDQQIRNAGLSVVDAMLTSARDNVVAIASGTAVGQEVIRTVTQQQTDAAMQKWGPLVLIGFVVAAFMIGAALFRRR